MSRLDDEEAASENARVQDYKIVERVPSSFGNRYRVVCRDGAIEYLLFPAGADEGLFDVVTRGQWPDPIEVEPGVYVNPWCPPEVEVVCDDIYDGHVNLNLLAPDGSEYSLRLPIEEVRRLAKSTVGHDLE